MTTISPSTRLGRYQAGLGRRRPPDAFWELTLGPWDVAAGCLMVEKAGGRLTNPAGGPVDLGAPSVVASNGRSHGEMLARAVRGQAPSR